MGSWNTPKSLALLAPGCSLCLSTAVGCLGAWKRCVHAYGSISTCALAAALVELARTASLLCKDHVRLLCEME